MSRVRHAAPLCLRRLRRGAALFAALLSILPAAAASAYPIELDRLEASCCVVQIARSGDLLVVALDDPADLIGLRVFDYADPTAPVFVSELPLDATPRSLSVSAAGYVYAAMGTGGLRVVDLTTPAAPVLVGSIPIAGNAFRVEVRGTRAYVGTRVDGFHVFDISSPAAPGLWATYGDDGRTLSDFDVAGTVAGFCVSLVGNPRPVSFRTVDFADPLLPVALGTSEDFVDPILGEALQAIGCNAVASNGSDFFTDSDWVYAVSQAFSIDSRTLLAFDAPDYASARYAGALAVTSAPMSAVAAQGSLVHLVNAGLLQAFDPGVPGGNPLSGVPVWEQWGAVELVAESTLAFVTTGPLGVTTFDVSDPAAPVLQSHLTPDSGHAADVVLIGDVAVVSDGGGQQLRVVDVSVPSTLQPVSSIPLAAADIEAEGSLLFAGTNDPIGLQLVDLSLPESPALVGFAPVVDPATSCHTTHEIVDVEVEGTLAAVLATCSGLHLFDVTDPAAPAQVANLEFVGGDDIDIEGTRLALLTHDTSMLPFPPNGFVAIYDVSDPATPTSLGALGEDFYGVDGQPLYVKLHGDHAVVISEWAWNELQVFDLAAPSLPQVGGIPFWASFGAHAEVVTDGDRIIPAAGSTVRAVNVSDPTAPFVEDVWSFSPGIESAAFRDGIVFAAQGNDGFASYALEGLVVPVASPPMLALLAALLTGAARAALRAR